MLQNKKESLLAVMKENNIDAAIIRSNINIYYFTDYFSKPRERLTAFILTKDGVGSLIVPQLEKRTAENANHDYKVLGYSDNESPFHLIKLVIGADVQNIYLEENIWTIDKFKELNKVYPVTNFLDLSQWINNKRKIKFPEEVEHFKKAISITEKGLHYGIEQIKHAKTEKELSAEIEFYFKKNGAESMAFDAKAISGKQSAFPHGKPTSEAIAKDSFVLFDMGVTHGRFCADISRTVVFGEPTEEHVKVYNTVKDALQLALDHIKPGVRASELDKIARQHITDQGYGEYFTHRLGHGLGLELHEAPYIHEDNHEVLEPGMVFTVEPGIYIPEIGGVRIEDNVLVTEDGYELLTTYPKELIII